MKTQFKTLKTNFFKYLKELNHLPKNWVLFLCAILPFAAKSQFVYVDAASNISSNCHMLTPSNGVLGAVWYIHKINLNNNINIQGTLNFGTNDLNGADGIAFVLQPVSNGVGESGQNLGFGGISPSLAVEFDTYQNFALNDPQEDHIALVKNGDVNHSSNNTLQGPFLLSNLEDGQNHSFIIEWNATTKNLKVTLDGILRINYTDDIVASIFNGTDKVFWGFTASTGAFINVQSICFTSYTFTQDPALTWTDNAGNGDWHLGANWTGGAPPSSDDEVVFNAATQGDANINNDVDIKKLEIDDYYNGKVRLKSYRMKVRNGITIKKESTFDAGTGRIVLANGQRVRVRPKLHNVDMETTSNSRFDIEENLNIANDLTIRSAVSIVSPEGSNEVKVEKNIDIQQPLLASTNSVISMLGPFTQLLKSSGFGLFSIDKSGGEVQLGDNVQAQNVEVKKGTINLNSKNLITNLIMEAKDGGRIKGKGKIKAPKIKARGGSKIRPGNSPGTMTLEGDFELDSGADFEYEIEPLEHDLLIVQGTVTLNGNLLIIANGTPPGDLMVIDNDGTDPVIGIFNGLPQGKEILINGKYYFITYTGGTGNDVVLSPCPPGNILFVNASASGLNNGSSWMNALNSLQDALELAGQCSGINQIWVAKGTYKPTTTTNTGAAFELKNNVAIYGGFAGNEVSVLQRNFVNNVSILSGDIGILGNSNDNSIDVVRCIEVNNTAILDGFTISGSNGGAGITNNYSSPKIINCIITENTGYYAGGISNYNSSPSIINCLISGNKALEEAGGSGMDNFFNSSPLVINCTFSGNSGSQAPAIYIYQSNPMITNCIIWGNQSGIFVDGGGSNPQVTYSIVQGGFSGTGNKNQNPLFSNPGSGNYRLQQCSPAINSGSNQALPSGINSDLDLNPRKFNNGIVDMGAFEFQGNLNPDPPTGSLFITNSTCSNCSLSGGSISIGTVSGTGGTLMYSTNNGQTWSASLPVYSQNGPVQTILARVVSQNGCQSSSIQVGMTNPGSCITPDNPSGFLDITNSVCTNCNLSGGNIGVGSLSSSQGTVEYSDNEGQTWSNQIPVYIQDGPQQSIFARVLSSNGCISSGIQVGMTSPGMCIPADANINASNGLNLDCNNPETYLNVSPASAYIWTRNNLPISEGQGIFVSLEGEYRVTVTAENGCESSSFVTVSYTEDTTPPTLECKNINVSLDENGIASIEPFDVFENGYDNCGVLYFQSVLPNTFNCNHIGTNQVILKVFDGNGNMSTCNANVNIEDNLPPDALCQSNITVQLDETGSASLEASILDNGSSDVCGILYFQVSSFAIPPSGSSSSSSSSSSSGGNSNNTPTLQSILYYNCNFAGQHPYTLYVSDEYGNTASCTGTITVQDNMVPSALCQNVTIQLNASGDASVTALEVNDGSFDNCGILSYELSQTAFDCGQVGANTVTLTVTDVNTKSSSCTATVTVEDNVAPSALCQNVTIQLNASGDASVTALEVNDGSFDNCGILSYELSQTAFDCSHVGANTVTLTVTDVNTKSSSCIATVTVEDTMQPAITCPSNITVNNDSGQCNAVVQYTINGNDNCSYELYRSSGLTSGSSFPIGITFNTWMVSDNSGNTSSCSFTVTVNKAGDPDLLWAYTVIAFDEVKMKKNTVQSGGIGMIDTKKDKVKLESNTIVTAGNSFVKAPNITLSGGSVVSTHYTGFVPAGLVPSFLPPNANCGNNVVIPDNSAAVTLSLACYGNIKVGKNVTITFSGHSNVNVKDLDLKEGSTVLFAQNTTLRVNKKLDTGKFVTISRNGNNVWLHVDDQVKIDDGNNIAVNMNIRKNLVVEKTTAGAPTNMTGLFIAEKIDSKDNVFWNWNGAGCEEQNPQQRLQILDFNASAVEAEGIKKVILDWTTNEDGDVSIYEVEKSLDGVIFTSVINTGSKNSGDATAKYEAQDQDAETGVWLYRLKRIHTDGRISYSDQRVVKIEGTETSFTIYPNPAAHTFTVSLTGPANKARIVIVDMSGRVVSETLVNEEQRAYMLDVSEMKGGSYLVKLVSEGEVSVKKLIIVK